MLTSLRLQLARPWFHVLLVFILCTVSLDICRFEELFTIFYKPFQNFSYGCMFIISLLLSRLHLINWRICANRSVPCHGSSIHISEGFSFRQRSTPTTLSLCANFHSVPEQFLHCNPEQHVTLQHWWRRIWYPQFGHQTTCCGCNISCLSCAGRFFDNVPLVGDTQLVHFRPVCNKFISFIGILIRMYTGNVNFFRVHFKVIFRFWHINSCRIKSSLDLFRHLPGHGDRTRPVSQLDSATNFWKISAFRFCKKKTKNKPMMKIWNAMLV